MDNFWIRVDENKKRWNELLEAKRLLEKNFQKETAKKIDDLINHEVSNFCFHHNITLHKLNNKIS